MKKVLSFFVLISILSSLTTFAFAYEKEVSIKFETPSLITGTSDYNYFFHSIIFQETEIGSGFPDSSSILKIPLSQEISYGDEVILQIFNHNEKKVYEGIFKYTSEENATSVSAIEEIDNLNKEKEKTVVLERVFDEEVTENEGISNTKLVLIGFVFLIAVGSAIFIFIKKRQNYFNDNDYE